MCPSVKAVRELARGMNGCVRASGSQRRRVGRSVRHGGAQYRRAQSQRRLRARPVPIALPSQRVTMPPFRGHAPPGNASTYKIDKIGMRQKQLRPTHPHRSGCHIWSKAGTGANKGTFSCRGVGARAGVDPCARRFWERGKFHRDAEIYRALNRCMWGRGQPWSNSRDSPFSPIAVIGASGWAAAQDGGKR